MREQRNIALHLHGQDVSFASCAGAAQIFFIWTVIGIVLA